MTKSQSPDYHVFKDFPLPDYYEADDVVDRALPVTTRPVGMMHRSPGAPHVSQPQRNMRLPSGGITVGTMNSGQGSDSANQWGREVAQWANSTFPNKLDGVTAGKVRSRAASDGSIVFATGLDRQPDSVMIQPREPVNFIRAYVVPEEERHLVDAAKGLVLAPGDVVIKCIIFDQADTPSDTT